MQLKPNTPLKGGEFRIIKQLGHGGFGITYLAEQPSLENRKVCIKEFFPGNYYRREEDSLRAVAISENFAEDMEVYKQKFHKEAKTIASFNHNNIVKIYDVFHENNTVYYAMEYIDGCTLRETIADKRPLSKGRALKYIRETAKALAHIHKHGCVHLDIKPANIMVREEDDSVIVIDFGLSKHFNEDGTPTSTTPGGFSRGYTPLEMYQTQKERKFLPPTDIYSLGATLYALLTGEEPVEASDVSIYGVPQHSNIDAQLYSVIDAAMTPNPTKRPQSIKEFLTLLDSAVGGGNGDNGGNNDGDNGSNNDNGGSQDNGSNGGNNDNGDKTIIKTAATSKIEDIVNDHFEEAGRAGIIIKTNKSDIIYTDIFIDGVKSFTIKSKAKSIGTYRVYANSALVTDALTKLSNKFSKIILPGNEHVLGNQPQVIQSIINDVVTTIDPTMEASRISSKCYITKDNSFSQILLKLFMYLILPAGVSYGIGVLLAPHGGIKMESMGFYTYDVYESTIWIFAILFTPIFSIIFGWLLNIRQKIDLSEILLKIFIIFSLFVLTLRVINIAIIPDEIINNNFNFGDIFTNGENGCYSDEDVVRYIEDKLNGDKSSIGEITLIYTLFISLYHYIHSTITYKRSKNKGGLWFKIVINTIILVYTIIFIQLYTSTYPKNWAIDMDNYLSFIANDIFFISIPWVVLTIFFAYANKPRKLLKGASIK